MYLYICVMSHIHVEIKICFYFWQQYKYEVPISSENLIFSPDYLLILTARMIIVWIGT